MEKVYKKLVRDNIPEIIEQQGHKPLLHILDQNEYKKSLIEKLKEEVEEFTLDESVEELCDILEVIDALKKTLSFSDELIQKTKQKK
ncbi:nucleoside triphosphate pyrophosphohydrolase [Amphibacillus sp. Q70]|uniref:nucleoside triphosphate pyrophosphohydrolase n=1 Tax=Amphibacillus sp. Q70 TaxID=3453416 RepID=UPI003F868603